MDNINLLIILVMSDMTESRIIIEGKDYSDKQEAIEKALTTIMLEIQEHNRLWSQERHKRYKTQEEAIRIERCDDIKEIKIYELP